MGINQCFNEINSLMGCSDRLEVEERSVKQMLIDKGEWTDEDEAELLAIRIENQQYKWGERSGYESDR